MKTCENCGCKVYSGRCINCHEELFIIDQYIEQGMNLPKEDSDFMKKVRDQEIETSKKRWKKTIIS